MEDLNIKELHHHDDTNTNFVLEHMPKREDFEECSVLFSLLSDPTRMQILWIVAHSEECVYNIAKISSLSAPLVSFHLRYLKQAKVITSHRHGKEVHYNLANTKTARLLILALEELLSESKRIK